MNKNKIVFLIFTGLAMDNRDRFAPISLPTKHPVFYFITYDFLAPVLGFNMVHYFSGGVMNIHAIKQTAVYHGAGFFLNLLFFSYGRSIAVRSDDNPNNFQPHGLGEFKIP